MLLLTFRHLFVFSLALVTLTVVLHAQQYEATQSANSAKAKQDLADKPGDAAKAKAAEAAKAKDADPIKAKLDKAKAAYEADATKQRDAMLEGFQKKEDSAARAGDKKLRDQVRSEREKFETRGAPPEVIPTMEYQWRMKQANRNLEAAYRVALKDYLIAKKDYEAEAVDKELADFKKKNPEVVPPEVWVGVSMHKTGTTPVKLEIESFDGANFRGNYYGLFQDGSAKNHHQVEGRIELGIFSFKHVKVIKDGGWPLCVAAGKFISSKRIEGTWESAQGDSQGTFYLVPDAKKK